MLVALTVAGRAGLGDGLSGLTRLGGWRSREKVGRSIAVSPSAVRYPSSVPAQSKGPRQRSSRVSREPGRWPGFAPGMAFLSAFPLLLIIDRDSKFRTQHPESRPENTSGVS